MVISNLAGSDSTRVVKNLHTDTPALEQRTSGAPDQIASFYGLVPNKVREPNAPVKLLRNKLTRAS